MALTEREAALKLLGLAEGADKAEIRRAWRALVRAYHPDHARDDPEGATRRLAEINAAFDALMADDPAPAPPKPQPKPQRKPDVRGAQQRAQEANKLAADQARRKALKEKILSEKARAARLRKGVEKKPAPDRTPTFEENQARSGFEEARKVFEAHPRAQIRSIFA